MSLKVFQILATATMKQSALHKQLSRYQLVSTVTETKFPLTTRGLAVACTQLCTNTVPRESLGSLVVRTMWPTKENWIAKQAQIFLWPDAEQLPGTLVLENQTVSRSIKKPPMSAAEVAYWAGAVSQYPRRLLTAEPELVVQLLDALKGRHLKATRGLFRLVSAYDAELLATLQDDA